MLFFATRAVPILSKGAVFFAHARTRTRTVASERAIAKLKNKQLFTARMRLPDRVARFMQPASQETSGTSPIFGEKIVPPHKFDEAENLSLFESEKCSAVS